MVNRIYYVGEDRKGGVNCGRVEFAGRHYRLTEDAYLTNRVLPDGMNDTYFEMAARAIGLDNGKEYRVYWIFEKSPNKDLDEYDYDEIDRIEEC